MIIIMRFIRHLKENPQASISRYKTTTKKDGKITVLTCKAACDATMTEGTNDSDCRVDGGGHNRHWLTESTMEYVLRMRYIGICLRTWWQLRN